MEVQCYVDTCLSDIIIQFISGDELLKSSISIVERGWNGTLYLEVAFHLDGEYFCQVMNDNANIMLNESFVVSGKKLCRHNRTSMHCCYILFRFPHNNGHSSRMPILG